MEKVYVVVGYQEHFIKRLLENFEVNFITNPDFKEGKGTSIRTGIEVIEKQAMAALIVLGDMPYLRTETFKQLLEAFSRNPDKKIFVPTFKGKFGNPVLWHRKMFPYLLGLDSDNGGKILFEEFGHLIKKVPVKDKGILRDIDTKKDLSF